MNFQTKTELLFYDKSLVQNCNKNEISQFTLNCILRQSLNYEYKSL